MVKPIKTYSLHEIEELVAELGQPKFRAQQLCQWLYAKHARCYDEMTNLPLTLRSSLEETHPLHCAEVVSKRVSKDGTRKYIVRLHDGELVETVGMPSTTSEGRERLTVCFSSQVGCAIGCVFCATGHEGFKRNLSIGEIADQITLVQNDFGKNVTNAVGMGQGEPFLNYANLIEALRIINNPRYHNIGARHITVSTCGILKGIEAFSEVKEQFTLAVSLHAARQEVRNELMPHMKNQPLPQLKRTLARYLEATNRRISLEYLMIQGINDSEDDLRALEQFCDGLLCHVNLLPLNKIKDSPFVPCSTKTVNYWIERLNRAGHEATLRKSRGSDISGACGQLKNSR